MIKSRSKAAHRPEKKSPRRVVNTKARHDGRAAAPSAARKGRWVYGFGGGKAEGRANMRNLLGGKGAGLAEMAHLGFPVPPGFTITTEVCTYFYQNGEAYPKDLKRQVETALAELAASRGKNSATATIRYWSRCARGRVRRCPA